MIESVYTRNEQLLGEEVQNKIKNSCVAIIGLGGVGGMAAETLARLGVGKLVIIDFDTVNITNFNRQIIATNETLNKSKTSVMEQRIKQINNRIKVVSYNKFINKESFEILLNEKVDFVIDAIDSVQEKWELIKFCLEKDLNFVTSLGMGNKIDPSQIIKTTLAKTSVDPLAKKLRQLARKDNININKIDCVFSKENPLKNIHPPASIMLVPAVAGIYCGSYFLDYILANK